MIGEGSRMEDDYTNMGKEIFVWIRLTMWKIKKSGSYTHSLDKNNKNFRKYGALFGAF